jgi:nucleoside-diphosphate-sugar epimerase
MSQHTQAKLPDWKGRQVVILGGAGFIGSNLAIRLAGLNAQVTVIDGLIPGCGGHRANLEEVSSAIRLVQVDLAQGPIPVEILQASVVFDLMGDPAHARSLVDPRRDLACNLLSQINVLEALRRLERPPLLVLASTRQVYGAARDLPVAETHPLAPPDPNGIHKLAAEQYATLYERLYRVPTVVLRLTNVYGPRQGNASPAHGVAGFLIGRLLRGEPLLLFGGGKWRRDWLYVDDAVDALIAASYRSANVNRIYNVGHDQPNTLREFADLARDILGRGDIRDVPWPSDQQAIDVGHYWTDATLAERDLHWRASTPLRAGLERAIAFYQSKPEGELWPPQ